MSYLPELIAVVVIIIVWLAAAIILREGVKQHPVSKNPTPTFPNFWRRGDR